MWRRGASHVTRRVAFAGASAGALALAAHLHPEFAPTALCESAVRRGALLWGDRFVGTEASGYECKSPEALQLPAEVTHVAFAESSGALTDAAGNVWAWGRSRGCDVGTAQLVLKGKRAVKVACGNETTYALTKGGRVFSWRNDAPESVAEVSFPPQIWEMVGV